MKRASGAQRVAAFLLSLEKGAAARVLEKLDAHIVADVAAAMTELDSSFRDPASVDALYADLARALHEPPAPRSAAQRELSSLLTGALGQDRASAVLARIADRRRYEHPFGELEAQPVSVAAKVLQRESAAVAALVISHADARFSAEILSTFAPEHALDVVQRLARIAPVDVEVLTIVASTLKDRAMEIGRSHTANDPSSRLRVIAQMLNRSDKSIERHVLEGLERTDKTLVGDIRELMFTWDDVAKLDKRGMQRVLSSVETHALAIALKACSPEIEANVFSNLSPRVRAMVIEEREIAGAVSLADVRAARADILRSIRAMLESGEMTSARTGDELVQ